MRLNPVEVRYKGSLRWDYVYGRASGIVEKAMYHYLLCDVVMFFDRCTISTHSVVIKPRLRWS